MVNFVSLAIIAGLVLAAILLAGGLFVVGRTFYEADKHHITVAAEVSKERTDLIAALGAVNTKFDALAKKTEADTVTAAAELKAEVVKGSTLLLAAAAAHQKQIAAIGAVLGVAATAESVL